MTQTILKEPVLIRGNFLTGNIPEIAADQLNFYIRSHEKYGDYVKYQLFPKMYMYGLYHPDAVQHVLQKNNYKKPEFFYKATRILFGYGLFTSEGDSWLKQRRLAQPAFNRKKLEALSVSMTESIAETIKEWENFPENKEINISDEMMKLTLKILSKSLFSMDVSGDADKFGLALRSGFEFVSHKLNNPLSIPLWVPTNTNKTFFEDKKTIYELVDKIITARRNDKSEHNDLLDTLIKAKDDESGDMLNDQQLRDELITMLVAGHDTTSALLSWAFYLLTMNKNKEKNLLEEIDSVLGGRSPDFSDSEKLPYTKMVLEEALRIYPPAPGLPREAIEDDEINGYLIKKKVTVVLGQYVTHRHPEFWEKPNEFYPEHFEKDKVEKRHKFAFFPFGGGSRMCIGIHFAMLEAQLILSSLLQRFDFQLVKNQDVVIDTTFTLMPKNGIRMIINKRK